MGSTIQPETIKRTKSGYHDEKIEHEIASATSIRKEIIKDRSITDSAYKALPVETIEHLKEYLNLTSNWHDWELYFPYLQLLVQTKSHQELRQIQGVIEGLEYRLKQTVQEATDFHSWMTLLKTKRYTWTRLQRMFVHLLTNTTKEDLEKYSEMKQAPYTRILGMNQKVESTYRRLKRYECTSNFKHSRT